MTPKKKIKLKNLHIKKNLQERIAFAILPMLKERNAQTATGVVSLLLWPPTSTSWNKKLHTWHRVCGVPTHRRHHQTGTETFINSEHCSPWSPCLTDTRSGTKVEKRSRPLVWRVLVWDFCLCSRRAQLLLSNLNDMNYTLQDSSKQPCWWRSGVRVGEVGQKKTTTTEKEAA